MKSLTKFLHLAIASEAFLVCAVFSKPLPYTDMIECSQTRKVLGDAFALASQKEDLTVVIVRGNNMKPYFADGAILVIKHCDMMKIAEGSLVVYKDKHLNIKVKRIGEKSHLGWKTDCGNDVINEENYLGEVYVTFYTDTPSISTVDIEFAKNQLKALVASTL